MTYPIDQFVNLARANSQLALKLVEITRETGETCLKIGGKAASDLAEQARPTAPGTIPSVSGESATALLSEFEKNRDAAVEKTKAAFTEWQNAWKDAWTAASEQKGGLDAFQRLMQPWVATTSPAPQPPKAKATTATPDA